MNELDATSLRTFAKVFSVLGVALVVGYLIEWRFPGWARDLILFP